MLFVCLFKFLINCLFYIFTHTGICKCRLGFAYNLTTNSCEKRIIGSWCSHDKHCLLRSLNSICDKKRGECECAWGTRYEPKLDSCIPDTTSASSLGNSVNGHLNGYGSNRQVYYMSKCEQDSDCSLSAAQQTQQISSSSSISSANSPTSSPPSISALPATSTVSSSPQPSAVQSSTASLPTANLNSANLVHQPTSTQTENNNLMLEQADQENQFNQIRYLHGHRRLKDNLKRLTNYHLRELQCIRGRCICPSLHLWDGGVHCKEPYDTQSYNSSTHRHNRKNHNTFSDLDDELNDEFDDSSVNWQTIFLMGLGSSIFAGFIFR